MRVSFDMLSGERLRHELELLLAERHPSKSLALLADLGVIGEIVIGLEWSDSVHSLMLEIQRQVAWAGAGAARTVCLTGWCCTWVPWQRASRIPAARRWLGDFA